MTSREYDHERLMMVRISALDVKEVDVAHLTVVVHN